MKFSKPSLFFIPVLLFVFAVFFLTTALFKSKEGAPLPPVGQPVPDFIIEDLTGQNFSQDDLPLGQVKLVNFFASWCVPCRYEHPLLENLAKRDDLLVYGIAWKDEIRATKDFIAELGNPFFRIGQDTSGYAGLNWGVSGVPESYILDKKNIVRFRHRGVLTKDLLEQRVLPLIDVLQREK